MYQPKTSKKVLILAGLVGVVLGGGIAFFMLKKPPRPPQNTNPPEALGYFSPDGNYHEAAATKTAATSTNYCHDADKAKEWEGMRLKYPADVGILHLYALRIGLCKAVDDKKISLETAIDVFNVEHQKLIKERLQQKDPNRQLAI